MTPTDTLPPTDPANDHAGCWEDWPANLKPGDPVMLDCRDLAVFVRFADARDWADVDPEALVTIGDSAPFYVRQSSLSQPEKP